jgi:hypothetical protein
MDKSNEWGLRRYATLLIVALFHTVLLAVLLTTSRTGNVPASTSYPVELLFMTPVKLPKIRLENSPPRRIRADTAISMAPTMLAGLSPPLSPTTSGSDGGPGVDWAAEARRAVQAFEIRSHRHSGSDSVSRVPGEDIWWPRTPHHAGERFKTPGGDWIVWINSNCYQVATSAQPTDTPALPQTVCLDSPDVGPGSEAQK